MEKEMYLHICEMWVWNIFEFLSYSNDFNYWERDQQYLWVKPQHHLS